MALPPDCSHSSTSGLGDTILRLRQPTHTRANSVSLQKYKDGPLSILDHQYLIMHFQSLLLVIGLALQALALPPTSIKNTSTTPIVTLDYATYQGSTNTTNNITSFLGVRYAAPPTGEITEFPRASTTLTE